MTLRKYIPDCITLMNLLCGSVACVCASDGMYFQAFLLIVAAALFDFLDGAAARSLKAFSPLGKELDSLSDLVSFGLAPALMLFFWQRSAAPPQTLQTEWVAMLLPPAAAFRLARFNTDTSSGSDFKGLAVPAAAMISAPMVGFVHVFSIENSYSQIGDSIFALFGSGWFIPALSAILALLMVSPLKMFSMKHKKLSFRKFPLPTLFVCILLLFSILLHSYDISLSRGMGFLHFTFPLTIAFGFTFYVIINAAAYLFTPKSRK